MERETRKVHRLKILWTSKSTHDNVARNKVSKQGSGFPAPIPPSIIALYSSYFSFWRVFLPFFPFVCQRKNHPILLFRTPLIDVHQLSHEPIVCLGLDQSTEQKGRVHGVYRSHSTESTSTHRAYRSCWPQRKRECRRNEKGIYIFVFYAFLFYHVR